MNSQGVLAVVIPLLWSLFNIAEVTTSSIITTTRKPTNSSARNNSTLSTKHGSLFPGLDSSMIQRALYVLIGITMIGMLYFIVRAVRLKKSTQRRKYGLLSNYDDNMEMAELESDEEDTTVYEAKTLKR